MELHTCFASSAEDLFGHSRVGQFLGTHGAFFARGFQKTEGKREKATVSLTVVFFNESDERAEFSDVGSATEFKLHT
jgi:hypothetical protein